MADGLWNLYAGAGIQSSTAKNIGSVAGLATSGSYHRGRKKKLVRDLATGTVKANQLGAGDLASLGLSSSGSKIKVGDNDDGGRSIGGLFKNLGSDLFDAAKGLGPGLLQLGTAIFHDIGPRGPLFTGKSAVSDKIIKPTVEQYKKTYSGDILGNLYKHPLQPLLDIATVASGGAAGAAKIGRVAKGRGVEGGVANLARITSRDGRAPAVTSTGIEIPREYTPRPLSKAGQIGLDKLGQRIEPVGNWQGKKALQRDLKLTDVEVKGQAARAIADIGKPIADRFKNLEIPEQIALGLSLRGINTPELVERAQEGFRTALEDPKINAKAENLGIDRVYRETLAKADPRIQQLVANPTPAMREAAQIWDRDVSRGLEELPLTPEQHQAHISSYQRRLLAEDPEAPLPAEDYEMTVPEGVIAPNYVPDLQATGFKPHRQGEKLNRLTRGLTPTGQLTFRRGPAERLNSTQAITSQNLLTPNSQRYLHDSSGETFDQGLFRIDPRLYVEHASKREKDLIENAFNAQLVETYAHKDENGEMTKFKTPGDVERMLGPDWVHVNPEYPIAWFRNETKFTERAEQVMRRLQDANHDDAAVLERMMEEITDADAKAFIIQNWGAMKRPGVAIPRDFFEYQKQLVEVSEPFRNPGMRAYVKFMHHWRNTVLAYMPRWGLNTAIGSFITNMVKGVMNPQHYIEADRMRRSYINPETGETVVRGFRDKNFDTSGLERMEPVGVALQEQAMAEMLEPSMAAYQQAMDIRMPTRKLVAGVQHIEDFFRRASFVHSLKQIRKREGEPEVELEAPERVIEEMGDVLSDHYERVTHAKGSVAEMLQDPKLVDRALRDTNKFGYNYGALGPWERRVLRQFIPFWGWYKFISSLAYRLPVELPGRTAALNQLAMIGNDAVDDLGMVPEWMKGSIILGVNEDGSVKYLPTMGMNPFSSFFNPLSPKGSLEGMISTGMMSPVVQAGLQGIGYDTLTGGPTRVSPQSGVTQDFMGQLINDKGEVVSTRSVAPWKRGLMALARSVPQFRLGEKHVLEGGGSVYPESVPILAPRPMSPPSKAAFTTGSTVQDMGLAVLGLNPRGYDLTSYQNLTAKRALYNRKKRQRDLMKLKRKFEE